MRMIVLASLLLFGTAFLGCSQEVEPTGPKGQKTSPDVTRGSASDSGGSWKVFLDDAEIDVEEGAVTLPLHHGLFDGENVYYIITDVSDRDMAKNKLGVNWAPKLANAAGTDAVQYVKVENDVIVFSGTVDFSPERVVVPGPNGFPPDEASPGSEGDMHYSPLMEMHGAVINAPHVANDSGWNDSVIDISIEEMRVTLELVDGFYHGKEILYISTEASARGPAALEASTYAPNLNAAPGLGESDPRTSARAAIIPFVNGPSGIDNAERQGLNSALMGEGHPLNVTVEHPNNRHKVPSYSPLWDVHLAMWTDTAIENGERQRLDHHKDIKEAFEDGLVVSVGDGPENPELGGLRAAGFIVNCPIIALR